MTYSIVYSTLTGNTLKLASKIKETLKDVLYFGQPNQKALEADVIFVGFWTNQGKANDEILTFLKEIKNKKIVLFGTCGFELPGYFDEIIKNTKEVISNTNEILGSFISKGKINPNARKKYEALLENEKTKARGEFLIKNFDASLTHPDLKDLTNLEEFIKNILQKI